MTDKIECPTHGESPQSCVCIHLTGESAGLGFNRNIPSAKEPCPDAWCDDCELIRIAHDGWNKQAGALCETCLLCSGCYERARIRNTKPAVTFSDLKDLKWKCGSCEEWHYGPCLDIGFDAPDYWGDAEKAASKINRLMPKWASKRRKTFLDENYCSIENNGYFVRGLIHLPIIGCGETFCWGVWGSLSAENFEKLLAIDGEPGRIDLPEMFSWLSNQIAEYPDTLNLKMYARIQAPPLRPTFRLQLTDHPLAQEYHFGITPQRVKEITLRRIGTYSSD